MNNDEIIKRFRREIKNRMKEWHECDGADWSDLIERAYPYLDFISAMFGFGTKEWLACNRFITDIADGLDGRTEE